MPVILTINIIVLAFAYSSAQGAPFSGSCTFTHDCADWREGRVICDDKKRCSCRQPQSGTSLGKVFWDGDSRRCVHCLHGGFQRESRCYYFDYQLSSWADARTRCQMDFHGDLIVFNSPADLSWIRDHSMQMTQEHIFASAEGSSESRFWIGAMNEPFVQFGNFSWIDNRGFIFDQNSPMWCQPNVDGVPSYATRQPSWTRNNTNETRVSLALWSGAIFEPVYCLNDEPPTDHLFTACEINGITFRTECDKNKNVCKNEGVCTAVTAKDAVQCDCTETPYSGTYCTEDCGVLLSPCLHSGNCTASGACACTSLWEGSICEVAKDPCLSNPCQHSTKCSQSGNTPSFTCDCEETGWKGELCHLSAYPCPLERCKNNGQCKPIGRTNFTCNCLKIGYQGVLCEKGCRDTDQPCRNSGSCIENECLCSLSTAGDFCEIILDGGSASWEKNKTAMGLKLWLIVILCAVSVVLIIGLIYTRRKLFKLRHRQTSPVLQDSKSIFSTAHTATTDDNDSISLTSTSVSPIAKNTQGSSSDVQE